MKMASIWGINHFSTTRSLEVSNFGQKNTLCKPSDEKPEDIGNPFRPSQLRDCARNAGFARFDKFSHEKLDTMSLYLIQ